MSREVTEEMFLKDVEKHEMKVLMDNGLYRHLRFQATGQYSWNQWFDIITWPGRLAYTGDMGTYVFARLEDMFEFFRTRPQEGKDNLYINTGYWAEKLEAVDRCGRESDCMIYSPDLLRKHIEEDVAQYIEDHSLSKEDAAILREEIKDGPLSWAEESEIEARSAVSRFSCEIGSSAFEFQDTWEWDLKEYTGRFVWCCYALAWSIRTYDATKVEVSQ